MDRAPSLGAFWERDEDVVVKEEIIKVTPGGWIVTNNGVREGPLVDENGHPVPVTSAQAFQTGDFVELRSGSPKMTVIDGSNNDAVRCVWFNQTPTGWDGPHHCHFPASILSPV